MFSVESFESKQSYNSTKLRIHVIDTAERYTSIATEKPIWLTSGGANLLPYTGVPLRIGQRGSSGELNQAYLNNLKYCTDISNVSSNVIRILTKLPICPFPHYIIHKSNVFRPIFF